MREGYFQRSSSTNLLRKLGKHCCALRGCFRVLRISSIDLSFRFCDLTGISESCCKAELSCCRIILIDHALSPDSNEVCEILALIVREHDDVLVDCRRSISLSKQSLSCC